ALVRRTAYRRAREGAREALADHEVGDALAVRPQDRTRAPLAALHRLQIELAAGDDPAKTERGAVAELALGCAFRLRGLRRIEADQTVGLAAHHDCVAVHDPDVGRRDVLGDGRAGKQREGDRQDPPKAPVHDTSPTGFAVARLLRIMKTGRLEGGVRWG